MPVSPTELFSHLQECRWRGIGFPVTNLTTRIAHDLVVHARPDRDGARVEATGRRPIVVSATAVFRNGIVPGRTETWGGAPGALYPDVFNRFMAACADRTTGTLQHPLRGVFDAKCVTAESRLDGGRRDGEDVQVEWMETTETEEDAAGLFSLVNPIGTAMAAAVDLDAQLTVNQLNPDPRAADPDNGISFEDALTKIAAVVDTASLLAKKIGGAITRVLYRLQAIQESVEIAASAQSWPIIAALERLRFTIYDMQRALLRTSRITFWYVVPADTTMAQIAAKLLNDPGDMMKLNPTLVQAVVIARGTAVQYYGHT